MTRIFVFGSNTGGIHGKGAAKIALEHHGALWGHGSGPTGNSYALPTKSSYRDPGGRLRVGRPLPLETVARFVGTFIEYARATPNLEFQVTRIGCGLAGFADSEVAPLFAAAPPNCLFDRKWEPYLGLTHQYWGSY